ncbi:UNVERIFIED_CONTAM: hypothetical protein FKN15_008926 [Acipenser sinensis]
MQGDGNASQAVVCTASVLTAYMDGVLREARSRPAMEEILQRSHREHEVSQQVAALLPPRASTWGRPNRWRAPQTRTVSRTVRVPTAPLGDLKASPTGHTSSKQPGPTSRQRECKMWPVHTPASQEAFSGPAP